MSLVRILVFLAMGISCLASADSAEIRMQLFATQSGAAALDEGEGGGNPFASALIELLGRETLGIGQFQTEIIALTLQKSDGFQRPEIVGAPLGAGWQFFPKQPKEVRVAMILMYSDYTRGRAISLPGARNDMQRIKKALTDAGFAVQTLLDPNRVEREAALSRFSRQSASADVALFYTTGHGVEVEGRIYLLPGNFPVAEGERALESHGMIINNLGATLLARKANFFLYAGCRDNPLSQWRKPPHVTENDSRLGNSVRSMSPAPK